jgi:hypothetical protein
MAPEKFGSFQSAAQSDQENIAQGVYPISANLLDFLTKMAASPDSEDEDEFEYDCD